MKKNKISSAMLPETEILIVKKSDCLRDQLGVFTKEAFKKNQILFLVKGPIKSKPSIYSFSINLNKHIEPKIESGDFDFGHYMNHSCNPNAKVKIIDKADKIPYIEVLARRNIKKNEELTFDYASLEYATVANSICKCNAKNCRRTIHGFKDLPKSIVKKYQKEDMISKYLLSIK